jgi:hypothetical protein
MLRGIDTNEFCWPIDGIPRGLDHFAAVSISKLWARSFLTGKLGFQAFLNGGIGAVTEPTMVETPMPSMVSAGFGATLELCGRVFEDNFAVPLHLSPWLRFRTFQFGIDLLKSTNE